MWNYDDDELDELYDNQDETYSDVEIITGDDVIQSGEWNSDEDVMLLSDEDEENTTGGALNGHVHKWVVTKVLSKPTALHDGQAEIKCSTCGAVKKTNIKKNQTTNSFITAGSMNGIIKSANAIKGMRLGNNDVRRV